jgi:hypothetical protein
MLGKNEISAKDESTSVELLGDIKNMLKLLLVVLTLQFLMFLWVVFHLTTLVIAP